MVKRKQVKDGDVDMEGTDPRVQGEESDEDIDMVNVDFEWFDPQPAVDFHGLKNLLRQLFDTDAIDFDMSALADLILSQPTLGSTVKVDGNESDPYAFLSVLNLQEHQDKPVIKDLTRYLHRKAQSTPSLAPLANLLSQSPPPPIGLILTERLINMPSEVVPPMYTMLQEEIAWALEDNEPYNFSHYVILSKTYEEVESKLDQEAARPQKKKKKSAGSGVERFYFHPEDEVLERHALCFGSISYDHVADEGLSDSKRAFQELGIRTGGSLMLLEGGKLEGAVKDMAEYMRGGA
ncbi:p21-C-terminal region-binding protein-domain-containing protein [Aspergillus taichungensis]|uniref:Protein BCP1 n=1 Tax=Aspergillus taichungensis TaxID=482145 RepID=A0A2J5HMV5_9EURO|nr:p21-C-terminal region-binding protein-domain-containing protein [Aspergillus taichungensis]